MKKTYFFWSCAIGMMHLSLYSSVDAEQVHSYFWANYSHFRGQKKQASHWYQGMMANNPPLHSYLGYIHHLEEAGNHQKIVELYPKIESLVQDNPKIQLIYAMALAQVGRIEESDAQLVRLQGKFKGEKEIAFYTANKYLRTKEPENALSVIDDFLKVAPRRPQNFIFYFLKSQVYAQLDKYKEALENVKEALQLYPQFDKGWLFLALLEEQAGKIEQAIQGYTSYLEHTTEPNKSIEQHLMQLAMQQQMAQSNKRMIALDQPCLQKAAALFDRRQFRQALTTIDECLKKTPQHVELRLLKLRTLMAMEKPDEAVAAVGEWIDQNPVNELWYSTLHLLVRSTGKTDSASAMLSSIAKKHPDALQPTLYLADLALRAHDAKNAQIHLQNALARTTDSSLQVKVLFQLALLAFQTNDAKMMGEALERAHALDPNFIPAANLLAHHLTHSGKDHERAQRLISAALEKHPRNIHLLDTQALIYENQKKVADANEIRNILAKQDKKCKNCDQLKMAKIN